MVCSNFLPECRGPQVAQGTLLKTWVVPPAAARRGRQGSDRMALKRHRVFRAASSSSQPVMSSLMSSLG